ncbi:hypothetical protein [Scale drop disease virus]|uniref:Uncharacterized protein n=1 Tax=Scale drop disease virus TaxID=1697349 RepID=A0A7D5UKX9_9VIRU|nr:hypothetical protein [Scale drop disease virus]QXJ13621.1 hypothetical protein PMJGCIOK_00054 [Scale drop disease virus]UNH60752.1 hypothetical protein SDDV_ORF083 [Scale drop disease virus]
MKTIIIFSLIAVLAVWCYVMWKKQTEMLEYVPENKPKLPQFVHDDDEICDVCNEEDDDV